MTLQQIAVTLTWVVMAVVIIWRVYAAVRASSGRERAMYISFYGLFFVVPLAVMLGCLELTPLSLYIGIPSFIILLFICPQGFGLWMKLWRRDPH